MQAPTDRSNLLTPLKNRINSLEVPDTCVRVCVSRFTAVAAGSFHSVLFQPHLITAFLNNSFRNDKEKRAGYNLERFLKKGEKKGKKNFVLAVTTKVFPSCSAPDPALQLEGVKSFVLKHLSCCGSNKSHSTTNVSASSYRSFFLF